MKKSILVEQWIPKINEYCIFYSENAKGFRISKFKEISILEKYKGYFGDIQGNYFKYCEPFVGEIPKNNINFKPEYGKFYIFYNKIYQGYRVAKFKQMATGRPKKGKYKDFQGNYFDFCCEYEGLFPFYLDLKNDI